MGKYSIKELEKITGVKAHTIRVWERRYSLLSPNRTDTNIRLYSDSEVKRLINISILNRNGLKISKLADLSDAEICEKILHLNSDIKLHQDVIENLISAMIDLDETKFVKIFSNSILHFGFENTITEVIFPFLNRVGILWQTSSINPAHEHFVSNLIRQKMLVAIDAVEPYIKPWSRRFLLYLPEGEYHELSLLFAYYILKKNNHQVVYLGQSVPYKDVLRITKIAKPDVIICSVVTAIESSRQFDYLKNLSRNINGSKVWFNSHSSFTDENRLNLPDNVTLIPNPEDLRQFILKLKYD